MSTLSVGNLQGLPTNSNVITIPAGHVLYAPGMIAQVKWVRTDTRTTYASNNSGNGTTVTALNLTITPKFANSMLLMQWMINGELHQDNVFLIHKDGSLVTTSGYEGYNSSAGNNRYSGVMSAFYDQNEDSTPSNWFLQYMIPATSATSATYAPAVRGSGGSNYTFHLNRTQSGTLGDNHESMISTGTIWEIMQ